MGTVNCLTMYKHPCLHAPAAEWRLLRQLQLIVSRRRSFRQAKRRTRKIGLVVRKEQLGLRGVHAKDTPGLLLMHQLALSSPCSRIGIHIRGTGFVSQLPNALSRSSRDPRVGDGKSSLLANQIFAHNKIKEERRGHTVCWECIRNDVSQALLFHFLSGPTIALFP